MRQFIVQASEWVTDTYVLPWLNEWMHVKFDNKPLRLNAGVVFTVSASVDICLAASLYTTDKNTVAKICTPWVNAMQRPSCKIILTGGISTHSGPVMHICITKLAITGSDNGLSSGQRQAIIWPNAGILLIRSLGKTLQWNLNTFRPRQNGRHFADDIFSAFSWMKIFEFRLEFHWSLFLRVQLRIFHHWFR